MIEINIEQIQRAFYRFHLHCWGCHFGTSMGKKEKETTKKSWVSFKDEVSLVLEQGLDVGTITENKVPVKLVNYKNRFYYYSGRSLYEVNFFRGGT